MIFAQMVDDPSANPDLFPTEKSQEKERQRLFRIIEKLVQWENTTNETVLQEARDEIWASWRRACAENADHPRAKELFDRHLLPAFHDPFAGGGTLLVLSQRTSRFQQPTRVHGSGRWGPLRAMTSCPELTESACGLWARSFQRHMTLLPGQRYRPRLYEIGASVQAHFDAFHFDRFQSDIALPRQRFRSLDGTHS